MHEYSIVAELVHQVEAQADLHGAIRIRSVHVDIGELSGVEVDLLAKAYEAFRERTLLAEAPLRIHTSPARWRCPRCERAIGRGQVLRCPDCGAPARLSSGDGIVLERIEMEVL